VIPTEIQTKKDSSLEILMEKHLNLEIDSDFPMNFVMAIGYSMGFEMVILMLILTDLLTKMDFGSPIPMEKHYPERTHSNNQLPMSVLLHLATKMG